MGDRKLSKRIIIHTGLFEMTVGVLTTCHSQYLVLQMQTPCDFFLWGYVKDQVYVPSLPTSIPELKVRIRTAIETITADMLQTVCNQLDYRVYVCRIMKGAHIRAPIRYLTKTWSVVLLNKEIHILLSQAHCV